MWFTQWNLNNRLPFSQCAYPTTCCNSHVSEGWSLCVVVFVRSEHAHSIRPTSLYSTSTTWKASSNNLQRSKKNAVGATPPPKFVTLIIFKSFFVIEITFSKGLMPRLVKPVSCYFDFNPFHDKPDTSRLEEAIGCSVLSLVAVSEHRWNVFLHLLTVHPNHYWHFSPRNYELLWKYLNVNWDKRYVMFVVRVIISNRLTLCYVTLRYVMFGVDHPQLAYVTLRYACCSRDHPQLALHFLSLLFAWTSPIGLRYVTLCYVCCLSDHPQLAYVTLRYVMFVVCVNIPKWLTLRYVCCSRDHPQLAYTSRSAAWNR
jgi:hypothetical protein